MASLNTAIALSIWWTLLINMVDRVHQNWFWKPSIDSRPIPFHSPSFSHNHLLGGHMDLFGTVAAIQLHFDLYCLTSIGETTPLKTVMPILSTGVEDWLSWSVGIEMMAMKVSMKHPPGCCSETTWGVFSSGHLHLHGLLSYELRRAYQGRHLELWPYAVYKLKPRLHIWEFWKVLWQWLWYFIKELRPQDHVVMTNTSLHNDGGSPLQDVQVYCSCRAHTVGHPHVVVKPHEGHW